jgi:hypothetical protein
MKVQTGNSAPWSSVPAARMEKMKRVELNAKTSIRKSNHDGLQRGTVLFIL